jgi:hypothetical protein
MKNTWLAVLCSAAIAGCSGGGGGGGSVAEAWPAKWCQAEPGMTKDALIALMGPPSGSSDEFANWQEGGYQFNAFLEPDGTVRQLDTNTYSLSEKQKAALACDTIRTVQGERERKERAAETAKPRRTTFPQACTLVTAAEMSAILGTAMVAEPDEHSSGTTACLYKPASGPMPAIELAVSWGDGEVAMKGVGMANRQEKGLATPYDGIGDEAAAAGPALFIRSDEDLIKIVFSGVEHAPAAAKQIFDTAKARM